MFVCFGGEGGVQFLPQAKLSRSPQQLGNRTQAPYYFLRSCCFYLQTNRNLFRTFTAEPLPRLLRPASPALFILLLHLHLLNNKQQFEWLLFKVRDNWNSDFQTLKAVVKYQFSTYSKRQETVWVYGSFTVAFVPSSFMYMINNLLKITKKPSLIGLHSTPYRGQHFCKWFCKLWQHCAYSGPLVSTLLRLISGLQSEPQSLCQVPPPYLSAWRPPKVKKVTINLLIFSQHLHLLLKCGFLFVILEY